MAQKSNISEEYYKRTGGYIRNMANQTNYTGLWIPIDILADEKLSDETSKVKSDYESQIYEIERKAKKKYNELEKENRFLQRVIDTLQRTVDKIFGWVSRTLTGKDKEEIKTDFEYDTGRKLEPYNQIKKEDRQNDYEMEL